jgi:phosphoribosylglycinamide formyltransferase 1
LPLKLGVLISGRGSNLRAIAAAIERGEVDARIEVVIANRPDAAGLIWATEAGMRTSVITRSDLPARTRRHAAIQTVLEAAEVELVVLAGFDEILDARFVEVFANRLINIHPSLLPAFGNTMNAVQDAFDFGVKIAGCTVHFVTADVDAGPIILQRSVEVREVDTADLLAERILAEEHLALPAAIQLFAMGRLRVVGRRVQLT